MNSPVNPSMPSMVLTLAEKTFSPKVIGIDANTPIFLKVLTIDGIDGLLGNLRKKHPTADCPNSIATYLH